MKDKDTLAVSTLRLIQAATKDRDIAMRTKGNVDGFRINSKQHDFLTATSNYMETYGEAIISQPHEFDNAQAQMFTYARELRWAFDLVVLINHLRGDRQDRHKKCRHTIYNLMKVFLVG